MSNDDIPMFNPNACDAGENREEPSYMDLDRDMWSFYTPTPKRASPEFPSRDRQIELPSGAEIPRTSMPPMFPLFGQRNGPPYQYPSVWAIPLHDVTETCLGFYNTDYLVFKYVVPDTRILVINEIGYEFDASLPINDMVRIRVVRDSELMAEWDDIVVSASPNPAERYAIGSVNRPVPLKLRVDRNQTITVTITAIGPYPNSIANTVPLTVTAKVIVYGYLDRLRDTRDGGAKPVVAGDERGADRFSYTPEAALKFLNDLDRMAPYFEEQSYTYEDSREFIEKQMHKSFDKE